MSATDELRHRSCSDMTSRPYVNCFVCAVLVPLDTSYLMPSIRSALTASSNHKVPCQRVGHAIREIECRPMNRFRLRRRRVVIEPAWLRSTPCARQPRSRWRRRVLAACPHRINVDYRIIERVDIEIRAVASKLKRVFVQEPAGPESR